MPHLRTLAIAIALIPLYASAVELEPIPEDLAKNLGARLSEEAGKIGQLKIKIDPDSAKSNGVHIPKKIGALIVPQAGLKESEELAAKFKMDPGASLAYLFVYQIAPIVDGKPLEASRMHTVKISEEDGTEHTVHMLLLAVRQLAGDDYRLYVYGKDAKPVVDAKFGEGTGPGPAPAAVELKDANEATREGKVVITVFGKFQASFQAAYTGE